MIKATYEKLTANMWLKTESFLSKIRNKTKTPPFTTSIQQSTRNPSQSNQAREGKKASELARKKHNYVFAGDMILYIRNPKIPSQNGYS